MSHSKELWAQLFTGGAHLTDGTLAGLLIRHLGFTARFAPRATLPNAPLAGVPGTLDPGAASIFGVHELEFGPWIIAHIDMHQIEGGASGTTSCEVYLRDDEGTITLIASLSQAHDGTDYRKTSVEPIVDVELNEGDELYAQLTTRSTGGGGVTIDVHLRPSVPLDVFGGG